MYWMAAKRKMIKAKKSIVSQILITILTLMFWCVAKLVPLCLGLCTTWLIIKCILNINLFNDLPHQLANLKYQSVLSLLLSSWKLFKKKDSDAKKIEPLTVAWLMMSFLERKVGHHQRSEDYFQFHVHQNFWHTSYPRNWPKCL